MALTNINFQLQNGVHRTFYDDVPDYLDLGVCDNENRILFYYADATEIVDFVETIIENLPLKASDYLEQELKNNRNIIAKLWYCPSMNHTCYEIYYNCPTLSDDYPEILRYMKDNNDFASYDYCYTKIVKGHQEVISFK